MRIVHACLRYPPATGGSERYVHGIVERTYSIPARDVRVLTSKMRAHGPISELDPDLLLDDPIYVQRLHHAATPFFSYPRLQALRYYLDHHQPDIVHGYSFWYQPADTAARFAYRKNIPFIFHPLYYETANRKKLFWQLYKKTIGARTFALSTIVVVISPYEQSLIEQAGFSVKRFELIPPGVDSEVYGRPRLNPFLKRKITGPILLTVGRISAAKGLSDLLRVLPAVIKQSPEVQLVIVGEDFGDKKKLRDMAKNLGIESRIHWVGKLSDDELIGAYQHAMALVHTSHYEAFGIVLAEALGCRTPVVARDVAAVPFVVPHERAGLLFKTQDELQQHILTFLNNPTFGKKLGQQGRKHVENTFSWKKSIDKLLSIYEEFRK